MRPLKKPLPVLRAQRVRRGVMEGAPRGGTDSGLVRVRKARERIPGSFGCAKREREGGREEKALKARERGFRARSGAQECAECALCVRVRRMRRVRIGERARGAGPVRGRCFVFEYLAMIRLSLLL